MSQPEERAVLGRSIQAFAMVAKRYTNASGFALYHFAAGSEKRFDCGATAVSESPTTAATVSYRLRFGEEDLGLLTFTFPERCVDPQKHRFLKRIASIIEALLAASHSSKKEVELAERISQLEAELSDEKISDRLGGLVQSGRFDGETIEAMERHVQKVLTARNLGPTLKGLLQEVERRVAERRLTGSAKRHLQRRRGITEEEAYFEMRAASRRTRTTIGEIAREILEDASD